MNTWAVSVLRYGAGIINWSEEELENMDRKTRKRMTIYGMLHPRAGVDHLYLPRRCGDRGLIGVEDCARAEDIRLSNYVQKSEKALLVAVRNESSPSSEKNETTKHFKEMTTGRLRDYMARSYAVPVVVGSLGMVTKNLAKHLGTIGIPRKIEQLQKSALLGSARLLRNVLEA